MDGTCSPSSSVAGFIITGNELSGHFPKEVIGSVLGYALQQSLLVQCSICGDLRGSSEFNGKVNTLCKTYLVAQ
jgi:hypothetical protein